MIRHMARSAALVLSGALLASGAWGQDSILRQSVTNKIDIASEYFGTAEGREVGRDVVGETTAPMVVLTVADDPSDDNTSPTGVTEGNVARLTYTLTGATFAETVSSSALTSSIAVTTEVVGGGAQDDTSVTIELTLDAAAPVDTTFTFSVPLLQVVPAILASNPENGAPTHVGVGVSTSLAVRKATGTPFSSSIQDTTDVEAPAGSPAGTPNPVDPVMVGNSQVYSTMMPALAFAWALAPSQIASTAEVDVTSRKVIIRAGAPTTDPTAKNPATATPALLVGTLNITSTAMPPKDLGGRDGAVETMDGTDALTADNYEVGEKMSGVVDVMVSGPFQSGDMAYLGTKALTVSGGMATGSVGIEGLLQSMGMKVVYVPGGVDELRPSTFTATAKLDFDDGMNASPAAGPRPFYSSSGRIIYDGYTSQGYAYGVVRGDGTDSSYVRIGCTSPAGCTVFVDCTDQAGMAYFGELDMIGGMATSVVSSDMIAEALGGGWSMGRGSCSLVSNAGLEVQHMVRTGHALINNSVVVNKAIAAHPAHPTHPTLTCTPGRDLNGDGDRADTLDETTVGRDLNGDGDMADTSVGEATVGQTCM
ncbi:MAG: hypothetical protein OXG51_09330 [Gammaproteobacteria bacterium]|nr:hypothetical protein [Gammaproteobacteria bacterium]MCY3794561.1 hypothetical protein [Gammaproteobacteria bacterium]